MLDVIIKQEIRGDADYVQASDLSWVDASQNPVLIILEPIIDKIDENTDFYFKDQPVRVWLYGDNKLAEATDIRKAMEKYEKSLPIVKFGIYSISSNYKETKIFLEGQCVPSCRHADYYIIQKNDPGVWDVKETELIWIN